MDRAYAVLDVKSVDLDARIIEGYATTPTTDRNGDVVDPSGAEFTLPMPLLWQHDVTQPIGEVTAATVTPAGIHITAKFATVDEPGTLRDRLDEAWQSVKARLVRGLSIGFKPIESKRRPSGGRAASPERRRGLLCAPAPSDSPDFRRGRSTPRGPRRAAW